MSLDLKLVIKDGEADIRLFSALMAHDDKVYGRLRLNNVPPGIFLSNYEYPWYEVGLHDGKRVVQNPEFRRVINNYHIMNIIVKGDKI
ncbi:MAG: hypothetical protein ABIJ08_03825 [Nanoarchaeota archaeon]